MPPPIFRMQNSFAGGELSPGMYSRVDIAKYASGMRTGRNVNILPTGPVRNRPGTTMVAAAGDSTHEVRLISFVASTSQSYIIELGQYYARFYLNDAAVQVSGVSAWVTGTNYIVGDYVTNGGNTYYCLIANTAGTFATDLAAGDWILRTVLQIVTPWAATDLNSLTNKQPLKFAQSADVMYFAHPSYAPQQLTFSGTSFSIGPYAFFNGPFMLQNTVTGKTITPSATTNAGGASITVTSSQSYGYDSIGFITSTPHGLVAGDRFQLSGFTGNMSVLNGPINGGAGLVVLAVSSATVFFAQSDLPGVTRDYPVPAGIYGGGTLNAVAPITLTASSNQFESGHVGALFQLTRTIAAQTISGTMANNSTNSTAIKCGSTWSLITLGNWTGKIIVQVSIDNATWTAVQSLQAASNNYQTSGDTGYSQCYLRVVGDGVTTWAGTLTYNLTSNSFDWSGIVQVTAYVSPTVVSARVITNTENAWPLADTNSTYQWSEGSWSTLRGWPTCVVFFQDRLVFASTVTEPATGWATKTASYQDFGISSPLVASDSLSFVLPSRQLNAVSCLTVMPQFMIAETSDSEWGIGAGQDGVFSPTSIQIQLQGHRGGSGIDPVVIGTEIILLQQMGTVVRNLIYQLAVSGFLGDNISVVSQHLLTGYQIVQMAYQQEPDSIVWMVRSDGDMIALTYLREQEVAGFTRHDTNGNFESVAVIPNLTLGINEIWVVVNRTIGGQVVRFIERMMPRDQGTVPANQFFVDCGLTYNGALATTISGLTHLIGKTVAILADGNVVPQQVVSNAGTITLDTAAAVVTVGLPYVSDVETMNAESPDNRGTLQGRRVTISRATMRFWNSRGGYLGPKAPSDDGTDGLFPILQRDENDDLDDPIPLKTRDYLQDIDGGYNWGARLFFRQVDPLPFTLTGIVNQIEAGEN